MSSRVIILLCPAVVDVEFISTINSPSFVRLAEVGAQIPPAVVTSSAVGILVLLLVFGEDDDDDDDNVGSAVVVDEGDDGEGLIGGDIGEYPSS
jgi:hypothetical protein